MTRRARLSVGWSLSLGGLAVAFTGQMLALTVAPAFWLVTVLGLAVGTWGTLVLQGYLPKPR
jgi:hypothetical protein